MTAKVATLVVDIGQTGTRLRATGGDTPVVEVDGPPGEHLATPGAAERTVERIRSAWISLARPPIDRVLISTTGFVPAVAEAVLHGAIAAVGARSGLIADDAVAEYRGAFGVHPGIVLIAGTGVVALAADGAGRSARCGGWGWALDDRGGGAWLGREGLRAAVRAVDGRGAPTTLTAAATKRYGRSGQWTNVVYGSPHPIATIAGFATDVLAAAAAGDDVARAVWQAAAADLLEVVVRAAERAGVRQPRQIAFVGGLVTMPADLWSPFVVSVLSALGPGSVALTTGADRMARVEALAAVEQEQVFAEWVVAA